LIIQSSRGSVQLTVEQWALLSRPGVTQATVSSILMQAFPGLDERGLNALLTDSVVSLDAWTAGMLSTLLDASTLQDSLQPVQWLARYSDSSSTAEAYPASLASVLSHASVSSDALSGAIQNYALDPSYFSGDYATTQFL
jgi:hypothetical protein